LKILRKNIRLNRIGNVIVVPKALSDTIGTTPFYRWPGEYGHVGNSLLKEPVNYTGDYGEAVEDGKIETVTIDSLNLAPSCIKLDVEGVEDLVVKGGLKTIRRYHPRLVIEIHRTENEALIREMLSEYKWTRRLRHKELRDPNKSDFDQVHLLGEAE
jgi:FkbM family methyltransferase